MKIFPSRVLLELKPRHCRETPPAWRRLAADMGGALANGEFTLDYQPIVNREHCIRGAEALLRWKHPGHGFIRPDVFIVLAERSGLIVPLGDWVLRQACAQLVRWSAHPDSARWTLSVNVSARQLREPDFVAKTLDALACSGARPELLKLELTESVLVHDLDDVAAKMSALRAAGVGFSLDDFGTGYASLRYLQRLPLCQLKIDRCFVQSASRDAKAAAIVRAIVALAHSLGIDVVAEGVETSDQRDFMAASGCSLFQGYLFGRPGPAPERNSLAA